MGFVFALWDWMSDTLYIPEKDEKLSFGLDREEHHDYNSVWRLYVLPFRKLATSMARANRRRAS